MLNSLLQIAGAVPRSPVELVTNADAVTKGVLLFLSVLSLVSWAIMFAKWREFRAVESSSKAIIAEIEQAERFEQAAVAARKYPTSPYTRVVLRAADFLNSLRSAQAASVEGARPRMNAAQVEALRLVLDAEAESARDAYGRYIPVLAMIASASPLIGLLGTVLGIIDSFVGISTEGSGSIGAVAPGVATALVATAAALVVAIPAVFGYNVFANRLNRLTSRVDGFGSEIIGLMAREGRL